MAKRSRRAAIIFDLALLLFSAGIASAAGLTLKVADKEPPTELDASIRSRLQSKAVQLLDGDKPAYEFWFCAEIPLQSKPASAAKALDAVKQATLLGAVSVASDKRDYRDDKLSAGVYTMRFALQPQDGNHLGTSEFSYYAALVPAKLDTKPDGIADYKAWVKASSKETATEHPVILSLRPAASGAGESPKLNEPAPGHKSVRIQVPASQGRKRRALFSNLCIRAWARSEAVEMFVLRGQNGLMQPMHFLCQANDPASNLNLLDFKRWFGAWTFLIGLGGYGEGPNQQSGEKV